MPPNFGGPAAQSSPVDTTARTVGACHAEHRAASLDLQHSRCMLLQEQPE